jgi:GTPase Era involved in 16S rRNA processing
MIPILKIFSYFNQLGDGFFKQLSDLGIKNENLEHEFKYLYNTHYFNILLCGRSGTGKSTFINTIMGEKKSFTLQYESAGTYRSNYYIHKDFPIKIIDVCGFAEGSEVNENLERLKMIYNEYSDNIIIDEYTNDSFTFYGDKRNDIHLLLYFNVYNDKYDVVPGELPIIMKAIEKKIPIIFIVNKCEKDLFEDEGLRKDTMKEVEKAREKTNYAKYETYFINCLLKKGFDKLLTGIYNKYKDNIISDDDLSKMKDITTNEEEFNKIIEKSKFFGKINTKDTFLNESLITSVKDIKSNVVKLVGYYLKELNFLHSFSFYLYKKLYNNILQNPEKNFFPILTDLVKEIYLNFGYKKSTKECNNYILLKLSQYFQIKLNFLENTKKEENKANEEEEEEDDDDDEEGIIAETPMGDDEENKEFDFVQFKEDYVNLGKLYWFSKKNFKIEQDNAEYVLKKNNIQLVDKIFNLEEENNAVNPESLFKIVKNDFGLDNSKNDATNKEKLIVKLFYISYVSNVLISSLCGKINHKGFKFKSVQNFYYTVSKSFNNAINGFQKIKEQIENEVVEPAHNPAD